MGRHVVVERHRLVVHHRGPDAGWRAAGTTRQPSRKCSSVVPNWHVPGGMIVRSDGLREHRNGTSRFCFSDWVACTRPVRGHRDERTWPKRGEKVEHVRGLTGPIARARGRARWRPRHAAAPRRRPHVVRGVDEVIAERTSRSKSGNDARPRESSMSDGSKPGRRRSRAPAASIPIPFFPRAVRARRLVYAVLSRSPRSRPHRARRRVDAVPSRAWIRTNSRVAI